MLNFTACAYVKHHASHSDSVQKLPTNARRLVKCPTNSSTVTYHSSNCQSNPINSTLDVATALGKFDRHQGHKINFLHYKISYSYQNIVENISMEHSQISKSEKAYSRPYINPNT